MGYAFGHVHKSDVGVVLPQHLAELERKGYPYDMVELRWSVGGDNGPPDADLPDVVKNWNAKYASPKLVIATVSRVVPRVRKTLRRQDSGRQRRFHALLGGRGRLVGPRNGLEPHGRRAAGTGRSPLGHARPETISRGGSFPTPGAT